jgi:hypothetical protein
MLGHSAQPEVSLGHLIDRRVHCFSEPLARLLTESVVRPFTGPPGPHEHRDLRIEAASVHLIVKPNPQRLMCCSIREVSELLPGSLQELC